MSGWGLKKRSFDAAIHKRPERLRRWGGGGGLTGVGAVIRLQAPAASQWCVLRPHHSSAMLFLDISMPHSECMMPGRSNTF